MTNLSGPRFAWCSAFLFALAIVTDAQAIRSVSTFATGSAVSATGPDSITVGNGSVWVSYTNNADSTGASGNSTVVRYDMKGAVKHVYSIAGSVDGLKIEPRTGLVWALQNQDGNSTLTLIDPDSGITADSPLHYKVTSPTRGYDDVVFRDGQIFLSYTNPASPSDPTIQRLENRTSPLVVTPVITMGATGIDVATGQANQLTSQNDPDSLKLVPPGILMLTSGDDGQLIFVLPGNPQIAFLSLRDSNGAPVSGLDDAAVATAERGTFYLTDTGNNRVLVIDADELPFDSLYACVGSLNELALVNTRTGVVTAFVSNLKAPHGLVFVPKNDD
jgi:hypothetical protein